MALEGKELEGELLGGMIKYSVDIDDKGYIVAGINAKIDLVEKLQGLANKSGNKIVIGAVETLGKMLGR